MARYLHAVLGAAMVFVASCASSRVLNPNRTEVIPRELLRLSNSLQRDEWCPAVEQLGRLARQSDQARASVWSQAKVNSIGMKFVKIEPGTFEMGPGFDLLGAEVAHPVEITRGFFISVTEVTNAQFARILPDYQPYSRTSPYADTPAVHIAWEEADQFCKVLSELEGVRYRLPTEAEWEYACRAGSTGCYCFDDDPALLEEFQWSGKPYWPAALKKHGWCGKPYSPAARVASFKPNAYGIYDMHGNALEWTSDWYSPDTYRADAAGGPVTQDPKGPANGSSHVLRGGAWPCWNPTAFTCTRRGRMSLILDRPLLFELFDRELVGLREATGFRVVRESD